MIFRSRFLIFTNVDIKPYVLSADWISKHDCIKRVKKSSSREVDGDILMGHSGVGRIKWVVDELATNVTIAVDVLT